MNHSFRLVLKHSIIPPLHKGDELTLFSHTHYTAHKRFRYKHPATMSICQAPRGASNNEKRQHLTHLYGFVILRYGTSQQQLCCL